MLKEHTIIRGYGFFDEPYILPAFLTPVIFSLQFIKKKLTVENKHFINFRKASEIKFPLKVGPLIIKIKVAVLVVEGLMQEMNFKKGNLVNYDPHNIIS